MRIVTYLDKHLEELLLVIFTGIMVGVIALQVFMRYFLGSSLAWSEELARYCFIWLVYIGISYGVKKQRHIKVDVLLLLLKERGKILLHMAANLCFLSFAVFVVIYGYRITESLLLFGQTSPSLNLPMGVVYAAAPIGMSLTAVRIIQQMYLQLKALLGKEEFYVKTELDDALERGDVEQPLPEKFKGSRG
ncbi:TRAP transporter small permease [Thalassorhabdus alkalitolerans]|uniref:TRAP transporter small permease n=2 Tax=Bacillaceae TaxID=186817 RepID=A0ABW0YRP3_9BACI|nr:MULTISPECIES: TRAP transporter small permease [Bacillaceae]